MYLYEALNAVHSATRQLPEFIVCTGEFAFKNMIKVYYMYV